MERLDPASRRMNAVAPGPGPGEVEAVFQALRNDPLAEYQRLFDVHGDAVRLELGPLVSHFLFHPEHVKQVLVTSQHGFDKESYGNRRLRSLTGSGLLFSEGEQWQRQRRLTQPLLASREHDQFAVAAREALLAQLGSWLERGTSAGVTDVQELVARAMFVGIMRALIRRELGEQEAIELREALGILLEESLRMEVPKARGSDGPDAFSRAAERLDAVILDSIRSHAHGSEAPDFLSRLRSSAEAEGSPFSEAELLAQVKTLLLAGHDSAAHAVVFALYFLSQRPDWQARVREEAAWLEQPQSLVATASRMVNTEAVVSEAMRLLPPIWAIERRAIEEIDVLGCRLPKGSAIVLSPYVTQRHPQFWPEPNEFRPERFLNVDPSRHRYAYFPFGGGSRLCVGNHVGLLQLKVALGTILSRYQIALAPDFQYVFKNLVVLRFLHGLPLHLTPVT